MRSTLISLLGLAATVSATAINCDAVYDSCIASYTSAGQSPFFPECNSRKAACQAGTIITTPVPVFPAASATPSSASSENCKKVYDDCISSYIKQGQTPFFPECVSRQAACEAGSAVPTTPVPTFAGPATPSSSSTSSDKCKKVYDDCISSYTSKGQTPFFPECASRQAACEAGSAVPTTPVPTFAGPATPSASTSAKCKKVYDDCISSYTSKGQSPFFPECTSRQAACEAGSAVPTTPVPTFAGPATPSASSNAKCDQVYNDCIQSYTTKGQSPFFPECNSRRAACLAGAAVATTPVPHFPNATPTGAKPPAFTGAAVAMDASAALGFIALVAAAII